MIRLASITPLILLALVPFCATGQTPPPGAREIQQLIEQLGSPDFAEREAATRKLEQLGAAAIESLRPACKSENPEIARRAHDVLGKAERQVANDRILAPTLVELDAKDQSLDGVLAALSKQAKCEVVLGGLKPEELADKKITMATGGKVPFWNAVLQVCVAADLHVAAAGGFLAPGAMPYLGRPKVGLRVAKDPNRAVVLETRDAGTSRRPAAVKGAVLVEAVPLPRATTAGELPTVLLQAWPEPRLQWQATPNVKIARAIDGFGARLTGEFVAPRSTGGALASREGVVLIRNADGTATIIRDVSPGFQPAGLFNPSSRQALLKFKPTDKSLEVIKELDVSLFGSVQSGIEPLSQVRALVENRPTSGTGRVDVETSVTYQKDPNGKMVARVLLSYDAKSVHPVGVGDDLPDVQGGSNVGYGNHTVYGVRVTDANGKPYGLDLRSGATQFDPTGKCVMMQLKLELVAGRDGADPPTTVTFWGTHARQVEVPITLKDVPLMRGK